MKLALHRSITFWSGILVMGFVCWAWQDSRSHQSAVGNLDFVCKHWAGFLVYKHYGHDSAYYIEPNVIHTERTSFEPYGMTLLPPAFIQRGNGWDSMGGSLTPVDTLQEFEREIAKAGSPDTWTILIPHWLILLTVALLWSGLLIWRARRRKRAAVE